MNLQEIEDFLKEMSVRKNSHLHGILLTIFSEGKGQSLYDFEQMEQLVKEQSHEHKMSTRMYIESAKKGYMENCKVIMTKIAQSNDEAEVANLIDSLVDFRIMWTNYDRYDFERLLKPSEDNMTKKQIKAFLDDNLIFNYTIHDDLTIDVDDDVWLEIDDSEIPVQFNDVSGDFYLMDCYNLTSLKGSPVNVFGNFSCRKLGLTSLVGAPDYVDANFNCSGNPITSLEGMPKVFGNFTCFDTSITLGSIFELSPRSEERVMKFIDGYFNFAEYVGSRKNYDDNAKTWLEFNDLVPVGQAFNYNSEKRQYTIKQIIN